MAKDKDQGDGVGVDIKAMFADYLKSLSPAALAEMVKASGVPVQTESDAGLLKDSITTAIHETIRRDRKEAPFYHERSVFNPRGRFDDDGHLMAPKLTFRVPTFCNGMPLKGELEMEEEIALYNKIRETKTARGGKLKAEIQHRGELNERLLVTIPSFTMDQRGEFSSSMVMILTEIINGESAVTPENMAKRIAELEARLAKQELAAV